jgi:hypothetical protein
MHARMEIKNSVQEKKMHQSKKYMTTNTFTMINKGESSTRSPE